jgi:hypothetical protein
MKRRLLASLASSMHPSRIAGSATRPEGGESRQYRSVSSHPGYINHQCFVHGAWSALPSAHHSCCHPTMPSILKPAMAHTTITTVLVLLPLPSSALAHLRTSVATVHYHPDGNAPKHILPTTEVIFCSWSGPPGITTLAEVPRLRHVQLSTSGVEKALGHSLVKEIMQGDGRISISSASGIHAASIPNYCVAMVINLLHRLDSQIYIGRVRRRI